MSNQALNKARASKNDEFYTRIEDVEKECRHYDVFFFGKSVYCPCDNPKWSSFWKYFSDNFSRLGLKSLASTYYNGGETSFATVMTGPESVVSHPLVDDGDFRSKECRDILERSDVVVTNPPFSLFRIFLSSVIELNKQFLIVGNNQALCYKELFPLILSGKVWTGYERGSTMFGYPADYVPRQVTIFFDADGKPWKCVSICWYTNLGPLRRGNPVRFVRQYSGHENEYRFIDGTQILNVDNLRDIPSDWHGDLAVPITLLLDWDPEQFEVLGQVKYCKIDGKELFTRLLVRKRQGYSFRQSEDKTLNMSGYEQLRLI